MDTGKADIVVSDYRQFNKFDMITTGQYGNAIVIKVYDRTFFGWFCRLLGIRYRKKDHIRIFFLN